MNEVFVWDFDKVGDIIVIEIIFMLLMKKEELVRNVLKFFW